MPFRHANAYGGYDYPAFPSPDSFDFINYDAVADPLMSPYDSFSLANPPEIAWTPTSQDSGPQHSDSLSPLEHNYAARSSASPRDVTNQVVPANQQLPLGGPVGAPVVNSLQASLSQPRMPTTQKFLPDAQTRQMPQISSQVWGSGDQAVQQAIVMPAAEPFEQSVSPPTAAIIRKGSTDSNSEASDHGRNKEERPEPVRTRTTDSAKVRHNIVERRYRENINAQVDVLRDSIVATMQVKDEQNGTSSSRLGADELKRLTKAAVIAAATQQIKRARSENDKLLDEHRLLQAQIKELEKMVKCGECPLMQLSVDMGLESPS